MILLLIYHSDIFTVQSSKCTSFPKAPERSRESHQEIELMLCLFNCFQHLL